MRGTRSTTCGGKSHSWVTAIRRSARPSAATISVADGSNETMRRAGRSSRPLPDQAWAGWRRSSGVGLAGGSIGPTEDTAMSLPRS